MALFGDAAGLHGLLGKVALADSTALTFYFIGRKSQFFYMLSTSSSSSSTSRKTKWNIWSRACRGLSFWSFLLRSGRNIEKKEKIKTCTDDLLVHDPLLIVSCKWFWFDGFSIIFSLPAERERINSNYFVILYNSSVYLSRERMTRGSEIGFSIERKTSKSGNKDGQCVGSHGHQEAL